ncbi:MAG: hypothetical protein LBQ80_04255 [Clostridium sp.]|jgi:hypothetical protein|nr:hypothetical protein [Clostridium sp.]
MKIKAKTVVLLIAVAMAVVFVLGSLRTFEPHELPADLSELPFSLINYEELEGGISYERHKRPKEFSTEDLGYPIENSYRIEYSLFNFRIYHATQTLDVTYKNGDVGYFVFRTWIERLPIWIPTLSLVEFMEKYSFVTEPMEYIEYQDTAFDEVRYLLEWEATGGMRVFAKKGRTYYRWHYQGKAELSKLLELAEITYTKN